MGVGYLGYPSHARLGGGMSTCVWPAKWFKLQAESDAPPKACWSGGIRAQVQVAAALSPLAQSDGAARAGGMRYPRYPQVYA